MAAMRRPPQREQPDIQRAANGPHALTRLPNIGPTIAKRLVEVGITDAATLEAVGPIEAYLRICAANPMETIPVCYYLYSLQGALMGMHWNDLPEPLKRQLRTRVGR